MCVSIIQNMSKKLALILGTTVLTVTLAVLGVAVWRVGDLRTVLQRPRAEGTLEVTKGGEGVKAGIQVETPSVVNMVGSVATGVVPQDGVYKILYNGEEVDTITVSNNGTAITDFKIVIAVPACNLTAFEIRPPNNFSSPITNGGFAVRSDNGRVQVDGSFTSPNSGSLTERLVNYYRGNCGPLNGVWGPLSFTL